MMKINTSLLVIAMSMVLTACDNVAVKPIEITELVNNLDNPNYLVIDTRHDSFYNGFKEQNAQRGGTY